MNKINAILWKEWLELRNDWSILGGTLFPPLLMSLMPVGIVAMMAQMPDPDTAELGAAMVDPALAGMPMDQLGQALIGKQFGILLLMMPMLIPSIIASYSIVGEKARRTLEPILATPISTWELLIAKSLAAFIPAVGITWCCAIIFVVGMRIVSLTDRVFTTIVNPSWLLLLFLCAPILSLITIAAAVIVSSRVNDPRTAQQMAGVVVIPVMVLFFGQMIGFLILNPVMVLGAAVVLLVLAVVLMQVAVEFFRRETILTRWK